MTGIIRYWNPPKGMVAVETDGGYSIFELLNDPGFEIGDTVSWSPDTACGHTKLFNARLNQRIEVYFQNHWVPPQQLRQQLLMD